MVHAAPVFSPKVLVSAMARERRPPTQQCSGRRMSRRWLVGNGQGWEVGGERGGAAKGSCYPAGCVFGVRHIPLHPPPPPPPELVLLTDNSLLSSLCVRFAWWWERGPLTTPSCRNISSFVTEAPPGGSAFLHHSTNFCF